MSYVSTKKKYETEYEERIREYNNYIAQKRIEIEEARSMERIILEKIYYDTDTDIDIIENFRNNLFDRIPTDQDFLKIFLGKGMLKANRMIDYKKSESFETNDLLANVPYEITKEFEMISECPITTDLNKHAAIGVFGYEKYSQEIM